MSHLKDIMTLKEEQMDLVVFVNSTKEAGLNVVYDPTADKEIFQVFIQQNFPLREVSSWVFESFREARNFAASQFKSWEMLFWGHGINRPCAKGDACGGGQCSTNKEGGGGCGSGGCTSCGATKEFDEML